MFPKAAKKLAFVLETSVSIKCSYLGVVVSEVDNDIPSRPKAALSKAPRMVLNVSTLTFVAVSSLGLTVVVDLKTLMGSPNESTCWMIPCSRISWPLLVKMSQGHRETNTPT